MHNRVLFLFLGLLTIASLVTAQPKQQSFVRDTSFVVNAGTKLSDAIPAAYLFHYPGFLDGKVFFRDGKLSEAKMNYNRLTDEMLFIAKSGDTLAIANEPTVRLICIEKDSFYFDRGYILLVKSNGAVQLGVRQGFQPGDRRRPTGYDMMSSTSSVTSLSSLHDGKKLYELEVKEETSFSTVTQFCFGDKYNHFVPATEKNLVDLFPDCAGALKQFCKKNNVSFRRKEDLEAVISFLTTSCP